MIKHTNTSSTYGTIWHMFSISFLWRLHSQKRQLFDNPFRVRLNCRGGKRTERRYFIYATRESVEMAWQRCFLGGVTVNGFCWTLITSNSIEQANTRIEKFQKKENIRPPGQGWNARDEYRLINLRCVGPKPSILFFVKTYHLNTTLL